MHAWVLSVVSIDFANPQGRSIGGTAGTRTAARDACDMDDDQYWGRMRCWSKIRNQITSYSIQTQAAACASRQAKSRHIARANKHMMASRACHVNMDRSYSMKKAACTHGTPMIGGYGAGEFGSWTARPWRSGSDGLQCAGARRIA
jgi:hypothetical protein